MKRSLIVLMLYLVIFGTMLITAIVDYFNKIALVDLGLPFQTTNIIIIVFSVIGLLKTIWHIHWH